MKKNIILSLIIALSLGFAANAQDARQRTTETIVQDALAALPAQNHADYKVQMQDLAKTAPESVYQLVAMLQPVEKGANNIVEYAISGLVNYVGDPANKAYRETVRAALEKSVADCKDANLKAFLAEQLRFITPYEVPAAPAVDVKAALKEAKTLAKSKKSNERCKSLWLYVDAQGAKSAKIILAALKDSDRAYRTTALRASTTFADEAFYAEVAKVFPKLSAEAKADVIDYFGVNNVKSQMDLVLGAVAAEAEVAANAIAVASKFGGEKAADALLALLGDEKKAPAALKGLKSIKLDLTEKVVAALADAKGLEMDNLLALAANKRIYETANAVLALTESKDVKVAEAALKALPGVVAPADAATLAKKVDAAGANLAGLQAALKASVKTLPADKQYETVAAFVKDAKNPERFYSALGQSATDKAVADLAAAYNAGSKEALAALTKVSNYKAASVLIKAAEQDEAYIAPFVSLVNKYVTNLDRKHAELSKALGIAKSAQVKVSVLNALANVPTMKTFLLAGECLDNADLAYAAAKVAKNAATKTTDEIDAEAYKTILNKAMAVYAAKGGADDGYAVDEIKKLLSKPQEEPFKKYELTAEEKAQGFEILFDGTNLDSWTGDFEGYTIVNGNIYVTASYGNARNFYTKKEYRDFVFRFEFCFTKPGVNNGVGIRTPMGVDAAYDGMCEIQVLDHDAPIYKGLRPHQVHGSIYGIVPAKRIVHKPLGEWSTQEIRVKGNRITVTVNGEVIVDADVKEACQGHNVAPDGGNKNPYTVDGKNHPGLFNKTGHIGFLGHGAGLKYRNVRILDLSK
jgi:hypothetical protein